MKEQLIEELAKKMILKCREDAKSPDEIWMICARVAWDFFDEQIKKAEAERKRLLDLIGTEEFQTRFSEALMEALNASTHWKGPTT